MGAVLSMSNDKQAYTMADRGTYLAFSEKIDLKVENVFSVRDLPLSAVCLEHLFSLRNHADFIQHLKRRRMRRCRAGVVQQTVFLLEEGNRYTCLRQPER